jgi:TIR domain
VMSEKTVIFISHSSKDKELAQLLKQQIELCFDNSVEAFAADIEPGENWFDKVMIGLNQAEATVVLITPNSVRESHWVWFELGYFWAKHYDSLNTDKKQKIYYPLYVEGAEWPNPVKDLQIQATLLNDYDTLSRFFVQLCKQLDSGDVKKVNINDVVSLANVITESSEILTISSWNDTDLVNDYSDEEVILELQEYLSKEYRIYTNPTHIVSINNIINRFEDTRTIFDGKPIKYKLFDREMQFRPGRSKEFLKQVASEFGLVAIVDGENTIRFEYKSSLRKRT